MSPAGPTQSARISPPAGRSAAASPADLRRKAHVRLAGLTDPARCRHKPLSLLRLEARRALEQFFDAECPALPRPDRDRLADEVMAESVSLGPLEELVRDPAVQEVMVLGPGQVIVRKADTWTPTSVRFRDAEQLRRALMQHVEAGTAAVAGSSAAGGFDVWLGSGFRLMAVLPPEVLDVPPTAVFVRGEKPAPPSAAPAEPAATGLSGVRTGLTPPAEPVGTGTVRNPSSRVLHPTDRPDPYASVRQQVTRRIITGFAAAGVHDLTRIPTNELRKIVLAYVEEVCADERLWSDADFRDRLTLEILAGMNR
jgi:hypothetical protein